MKKMISLALISIALSGCTYFQTHKIDVDQGDIMTESSIRQLHAGMSETQVKNVMGAPILSNVFSPNRIEYVYTFQKGHGKMTENRLTCVFQNGRLTGIQRS